MGRSVFITGGAGGFGVAFARMFLDQGHNVALADIDSAGLQRAEAALAAEPGRLSLHVCDVADRDALAQAALVARNRLGDFAFVCLNAGIVGTIGPTERLNADDWRRVVEVNLIAPAVGVAVFLPLLREQQGGGRLVFTASMAGLLGQPWGAPYSATKAGVISLAETLTHEVKGTNVKISVLCPGFANTPLAASMTAPGGGDFSGAPEQQGLAQSIATGLSADDVAAALGRGLAAGDFYIFTHVDMRPWLDRRMRRIAMAYDKVT